MWRVRFARWLVRPDRRVVPLATTGLVFERRLRGGFELRLTVASLDECERVARLLGRWPVIVVDEPASRAGSLKPW